jgi:putative methionine-R-sulfoxide reductase with GAF domain
MLTIIGKYKALSSSEKRAFWIVTIVGLILNFFAVTLLPELFSPDLALRTRIADSIPVILGLIAFLSAGFFLMGKPITGTWVIYTCISFGLILVPFVADGFAFPAAAVVLVIAIYIPVQVLPAKQATIAMLVGILTAIGIIILDTFLPGKLANLSANNKDLQTANLLSTILGLVILVGLGLQFRNFTLRTKLAAALITLTIIQIFLISNMNTNTIQNTLLENARQSLLSTAQNTTNGLDVFIFNNLDEIQVDAKNSIFMEYLNLSDAQRFGSETARNAQFVLTSLAKTEPEILLSYGFLDRNGNNILDTNPDYLGGNEAKIEFFSQAKFAGVSYVSPVQVSSDTQKGVFYISSPVKTENGEVIGVLRMVYDVKTLQQIIQKSISTQSEEEMTAILIDDAHVILAHTSKPELAFHLVNSPTQEVFNMLKQDHRTLDLPLDEISLNLPNLTEGLSQIDASPFFSAGVDPNVDYGSENLEIASASKLSTLPWYVVISQKDSFILAPMEQQYRSTIVLGILTVLGSILLAIILAQFLTTPLTRLTTAANKFAEGDFTAKADIKSSDEIGILANTFNKMTDQLSDLLRNLEQQVSERTQAIITSSEVSRRLSTILDQQQLVLAVVDEIQRSFKFYHAHIYLFDEKNQNLIMVGGTGEAGQVMLAHGHRIARGKGLVGRAAELNSAVVVPDTSSDPDWLPNPLLPETKAEAVMPISIGDKVLGVLDVQHNEINGVTQQTVEMLQSISNQVAIAVQNSRLFSEARQKAERDALIYAISQKILYTSSVENVLEVAARELALALDTSSATVKLDTNLIQVDQPE